MTKITDLLHKRILVAEKNGGYSSATKVEELKILEISPSGKWTKVQTLNGAKFWKLTDDINHIETLAFLEKPEFGVPQEKIDRDFEVLQDLVEKGEVHKGQL